MGEKTISAMRCHTALPSRSPLSIIASAFMGPWIGASSPCTNIYEPDDAASEMAPQSVRLAQCGSQAIAQKHQGPQWVWHAASLGTTTARRLNLSGSIWGNASIIAPGREGSQLGGAAAQAGLHPNR